MIKFKTLVFKNFLSVGDQPTILEIDKTITTIVTGINGAGKSTFIDALTYALFGKPFRKVRLGQLINTVNERGLEVEIEFTIGNKRYNVKRGMKPSIFEIYVDGEMIEQPATTADYQHILENDILKLNYKSFTQIIILGSASFKPFMQLKLADRREIIEDLLDISVFTEMNKILKSKIKDAKDQLIDIVHDMELKKERHKSKREYFIEATEEHEKRVKLKELELARVNESARKEHIDIDGHNEYIESIENSMLMCEGYEDRAKSIMADLAATKADISTQQTRFELLTKNNSLLEDVEGKIKDCNILINNNNVIIRGLSDNDIDILKIIDSYPDLKEDRNKLKVSIVLTSNNLSANKIKLRFYQEHNDCSECGQVIHTDFKESTIKELEDNIKKDTADLKEMQSNLDVIEREEKDRDQFTEDSNELKKKITLLEFDNSKWENSIELMTESIRAIDTADPNEMGDLKHYIGTIEESYDKMRVESEDVKEKYAEYLVLEKKVTDVMNLLALSKERLSSHDETVIEILDELRRLRENPTCSITQKDIDDLADGIKEVDRTITKKKHILHYFGIVQKLLKDDGIKTKIIRKFLPLINATVNMYLDKFDFPINFMFDENFNETIQSNFRSDFSYYSFSEGEKSRIDLALLFTWREIALKKSRNATNSIIFDEIFDGSLDGAGIENFMSVLGLDNDEYNSFIISHKDETKSSRFDRHLEFTKDGHFSKMKENI